MRLLASFMFFLLTFPNIAAAELEEKYAPVYVDPVSANVFFLFGAIDTRTALNFDRALEEFGVPDILVLSSEGGLVDQALNVARNVRRNGVNTLIADEGGCYSACALVFLAGKVRVADGELGVHQISSEAGNLKDGQVAISDILDVIGDFDVPNELLVDMFRTPPDAMHVLSEEEKLKYGFTLRSAAERFTEPEEPLETQAFDLLMKYNASWSKTNSLAIREVMALYDQTVQFYGRPYSEDELFKEKLEFAKRWPERRYTVDGDTVSVSCTESVCLVKANVRWQARSSERTKESSGTSYMELSVRFDAKGPRIIAENGRVISRD